MNDGIIEGNGTSRKVFANFPATYEEFRMQAAAGTLQMDVLFNAAGWQQQPTFLNRANLLQEAVASMFGLDPNGGTVNQALNVIGRLNSGLGNDYIWEKRGTEYIPVLGDSSITYLERNDVVYYSSGIYYDSASSSFVLESPGSVTLTSASQNFVFLQGLYITVQSQQNNTVYKCEELYGGFFSSGVSFKLTAQTVTPQKKSGLLGYVNSPDPGAYPPSVSDGFTYFPRGQVGGFARVVFTRYKGNGASTNTLNFNSPPAFVVIYQSAIGIGEAISWTFWIRNMTSMDPNVSGQPFISTRFSASGNSLTLTGDSHDMGDDVAARLAMNSNGVTYNVLAVL